MTTWTLHTTTITGDVLDHTAGTATEPAFALDAAVAAAHHAIDTHAGHQLPCYAIAVDDEPIAIVFTGRTRNGDPDRDAAHTELDRIQTTRTTT